MAITVLSRDASGRARQVLLRRGPRANNDVTVRGTDLREVLTNAFGSRSIRSTLFDVVANGREFVFSGRASATASACARLARSRA